MSDLPQTFRVIAVNLVTHERRIIETGKRERDADAIVSMTVARRGVGEEFYATEPER